MATQSRSPLSLFGSVGGALGKLFGRTPAAPSLFGQPKTPPPPQARQPQPRWRRHGPFGKVAPPVAPPVTPPRPLPGLPGGERKAPGAAPPLPFPTEATRPTEFTPHLSEDAFDQFMNFVWTSWPSSNCVAGRYDERSLYLELEFHPEGQEPSIYAYFSVSPQEAASMYRAESHGKWVWDALRIRGTRLGFRRSYVYLSAASSQSRVWDETRESAVAHGEEAERQTAEHFGRVSLDAIKQAPFGSR